MDFMLRVTAPDDAGTSVPWEEYFCTRYKYTLRLICVWRLSAREQKRLQAGVPVTCDLVWGCWFFSLFFFFSDSCAIPHCTKSVLLRKMKC